MKGIILAGGFGTRLHPVTKVTNKHLLPIYDKPMIYYPIEALVRAGIEKIMVITNPPHISDFVNLLGSGQDFIGKDGKQVQIVYGIQNQPSGLADALWIAKDYVGDDNCIMVLGDNVFWDDLSKDIKNFKDGAMIFLKEVKDPERFGVAEVDNNFKVLSVEEKPKKPRSNFAVTGMYVYDNTCFKKCIGQKPSDRGEYEIDYIQNQYLKEGKLKAVKLQKPWFDAGTIESLLETSNFVKKLHDDKIK